MIKVFTLQSIKSRIETVPAYWNGILQELFLLYSPLNQGLKLQKLVGLATGGIGFLLYSPLNQGLKLIEDGTIIPDDDSFYSTVH